MSAEDTSLATLLRQAREDRGQSLEQVRAETGMSVKVLGDLESGRMEAIEPVYCRLAAGNYATYLGIDQRLATELFDSEFGRPDIPSDHAPIAVSPSSVSTAAWHYELLAYVREASPMRLAAIAGGLLLALALLGYILTVGTVIDPVRVPTSAPASSTSAPPSGAMPTAGARMPSRDLVAGGRRSDDGSPPAAPVGSAIAPPGESVAAASTPSAAGATHVPAASAEVAATAGTASDSAFESAESAATGGSAATQGFSSAETAPGDGTAAASPAGAAEPRGVDLRTQPAALQTASAVPAAASTPAQYGRAPEAVDGPLKLRAEAVDSTWVQVQWDGRDGSEEIIPGGESRQWRAQRFFMVRAGRAHGVRFYFQGRLLGDGRLGDPTKVLRFRASGEGVVLLGPNLKPLASVAPTPAAATAEGDFSSP